MGCGAPELAGGAFPGHFWHLASRAGHFTARTGIPTLISLWMTLP
jgi:hypothetical protein